MTVNMRSSSTVRGTYRVENTDDAMSAAN